MKFRELLRELDKIGRATSKDLAHSLCRSVKEVSYGLGRLRRMGLVKADYGKRVCNLRGPWGDVCNRGYQYTYYVSEQGKSYLNWMNNIKPNEDSERRMLMDRIAACLPSDLKKEILIYPLSRALRRHKGSFRRDTFFDAPAIMVSVLDGGPTALELENQRLAEENLKLASESEQALTELSRYYKRKIEEMEREHIAREKEIKAELERAHATINTLSRERHILERVAGELVKIGIRSEGFLLAALRRFAPSKEYIKTLELTNNLQRSGLNCVIAEAVTDALGNSEASPR